MRLLLAILGSLSVISSAQAQVGGQPPCMPFQQFAEQLQSTYKEVQIGGGIVGGTHVVMLFASPGGATWTILQVDTTGKACGIAAGHEWDHGPLPSVPGRDA
jgi:hypothetical protein